MGEKISLGPGTLYFGILEPIGEIGELSVAESIDGESYSPVIKISNEATFEGTCKFNQRLLLNMIYTNNYRKLHCIPMDRKRAYQKIKHTKGD